MSSRNLKWAIYSLYAGCVLNMLSVIYGCYRIKTHNFPPETFIGLPNLVDPIAIGTFIFGSSISLWAYITAKRLKAFRLTAWKHAIIIGCLLLLDIYLIPIGLFMIYCLMDQNVRFLFKKEIIRISN